MRERERERGVSGGGVKLGEKKKKIFRGGDGVGVVNIYPHYRGKNGSLMLIGHKGRFLPLENSKNEMEILHKLSCELKLS